MELNFSKYPDGLIPAIIQDADTRMVLMLGFMNQEAFDITLETRNVTFFSRSRQTLWTKGETSGNFLRLVDAKIDCDNDTLLIKVHPAGPTCHKGTDTCWAETNSTMPSKLELFQQTNDCNKSANQSIQEMKNNLDAIQNLTTKDSSQKIGIEKECSLLVKNLLQLLSANNIHIDELAKNLQ